MYGLADYVSPIDNERITSGTGPRKPFKTKNGEMGSRFHHGYDIAPAVRGTKPPIRNITGGKVVYTGKAGGWGNVVIVENPDGYRVQYGHLDSINVKRGDKVPAGGIVGIMGETGNATGVHLDLIVTKNGRSVNRQGNPFATAPVSIALRATGKKGGGRPVRDNTNVNIAKAEPVPVPEAPSKPLTTAQTKPLFAPISPSLSEPTAQAASAEQPQAQQPLIGLYSPLGVHVADTPEQNALFQQIADLNLSKPLEAVAAEASNAITKAYNDVNSKPLLPQQDPLRDSVSKLFYSLNG